MLLIADDDMIGKVVDKKYKVIDLLYGGGLWKVYLVNELESGCLWKLLEFDLRLFQIENTQRLYEEIQDEIEMRIQMKDESIPYYKSVFEDEQKLYIIYEYFKGMSLKSVVEEKGPLSIEDLIHLGKQLVEGIRYLHNLDVPYIYYELHPSKIVLTEGERVKFPEFDYGRLIYIINKLTDTIPIYYNKGFTAPEEFLGLMQLDNKMKLDERTDIYRLGTIMHYLITAVDPEKPPYELLPIREINPDLPKKLEKIISKCLQRNPVERYQSCQELLDALTDYENHSKGILGWIKSIL